MQDAAEALFQSLDAYGKIEQLIAQGEAEGLLLESKAPGEPRLDRNMKTQLAEALSGFSNTEGGVIIWGVSTVHHAHSDLDVLTQIEPVGNCRGFARQIETAIPTLTTPPVTTARTRTLRKSERDTKGIVVSYVPKNTSDPIRAIKQNQFYFRNGDRFDPLPYEMLKRLFAATESPDLMPVFESRLVKTDPDGKWEIPIIVQNRSSAIADHVVVSVTVENPSACQEILADDLPDQSHVNPGERIFIKQVEGVVHRGLNTVAGTLRVKMRTGKRQRRALQLNIQILADKMRGRQWKMTVQLAKKGFSVKHTAEQYLY